MLSSRIEGTQATLGEVLKFEAGEETEEQSRRQDIYEIINYRRTLQIAEEELKRHPFNLSLLLRLHEVLLDSVRGKSHAVRMQELRSGDLLVGQQVRGK